MRFLVVCAALAFGLSGCVVHYYPDAPAAPPRSPAVVQLTHGGEQRPARAPATVVVRHDRTQVNREPPTSRRGSGAVDRPAVITAPSARPTVHVGAVDSKVGSHGTATRRAPPRVVRPTPNARRVSLGPAATARRQKPVPAKTAEERRALAFGYHRPPDAGFQAASASNSARRPPTMPARNRSRVSQGLGYDKKRKKSARKKSSRKREPLTRAELK